MPILIEELLRKRNEIDEVISKDYSQMVTIVFTDIVGSTEYFASKGDIAGRAMVQRHNDLLFPIIKKYHGRIIKTIGDAIMAGFNKASDGVQAAVVIQQVLAEHNQNINDKIHIRIGIHTGKAISEPTDIYGDTVNTAARVEALADGEQILLSGETYKEVEKRFNLHFHGNYSLKGLKEEIPIYEVLWQEGQQPKKPVISSTAQISSTTLLLPSKPLISLLKKAIIGIICGIALISITTYTAIENQKVRELGETLKKDREDLKEDIKKIVTYLNSVLLQPET